MSKGEYICTVKSKIFFVPFVISKINCVLLLSAAANSYFPCLSFRMYMLDSRVPHCWMTDTCWYHSTPACSFSQLMWLSFLPWTWASELFRLKIWLAETGTWQDGQPRLSPRGLQPHMHKWCCHLDFPGVWPVACRNDFVSHGKHTCLLAKAEVLLSVTTGPSSCTRQWCRSCFKPRTLSTQMNLLDIYLPNGFIHAMIAAGGFARTS